MSVGRIWNECLRMYVGGERLGEGAEGLRANAVVTPDFVFVLRRIHSRNRSSRGGRTDGRTRGAVPVGGLEARERKRRSMRGVGVVRLRGRCVLYASHSEPSLVTVTVTAAGSGLPWPLPERMVSVSVTVRTSPTPFSSAAHRFF